MGVLDALLDSRSDKLLIVTESFDERLHPRDWRGRWRVGQHVSYQHGLLGVMPATVTKVTSARVSIRPHDERASATSMTHNQAAVKLEALPRAPVLPDQRDVVNALPNAPKLSGAQQKVLVNLERQAFYGQAQRTLGTLNKRGLVRFRERPLEPGTFAGESASGSGRIAYGSAHQYLERTAEGERAAAAIRAADPSIEHPAITRLRQSRPNALPSPPAGLTAEQQALVQRVNDYADAATGQRGALTSQTRRVSEALRAIGFKRGEFRASADVKGGVYGPASGGPTTNFEEGARRIIDNADLLVAMGLRVHVLNDTPGRLSAFVGTPTSDSPPGISTPASRARNAEIVARVLAGRPRATPQPPSRMAWSRISDPGGDFAAGYRSGPYEIQRHHVDDRESGGGVRTYWNVLHDGNPISQENTFASAKRTAERDAQLRTPAPHATPSPGAVVLVKLSALPRQGGGGPVRIDANMADRATVIRSTPDGGVVVMYRGREHTVPASAVGPLYPSVQAAEPQGIGVLLEAFAAAPPAGGGVITTAPRETVAQSVKRGAADVARAKYDESKHPRGPGGKYASKGGRAKHSGKRARRASASHSSTLSVGAHGPLVGAVQRQLHIPPSGAYDARTRAAVRSYQRQHGLRVDGIVGAQTLAALRGDPNAKRIKPGPIKSRVARTSKPSAPVVPYRFAGGQVI